MKLNLGCRDRAIPGFLGMDCHSHKGVDIIGDIADLSQFGDGDIAEIYASNCLEHFPHNKTLDVLKEWYRVLAEDGKCYISVPDFARAVELYARVGLCDWMSNFLWGDQVYATAFHYAGFDEQSLGAKMKDCGFSEVLRCDNFNLCPGDCSDLVSNVDHRLVSLNLIGVK